MSNHHKYEQIFPFLQRTEDNIILFQRSDPTDVQRRGQKPQHACLQVALGIAEGNPQAALLPPVTYCCGMHHA